MISSQVFGFAANQAEKKLGSLNPIIKLTSVYPADMLICAQKLVVHKYQPLIGDESCKTAATIGVLMMSVGAAVNPGLDIFTTGVVSAEDLTYLLIFDPKYVENLVHEYDQTGVFPVELQAGYLMAHQYQPSLSEADAIQNLSNFVINYQEN